MCQKATPSSEAPRSESYGTLSSRASAAFPLNRLYPLINLSCEACHIEKRAPVLRKVIPLGLPRFAEKSVSQILQQS
eukprot:c15037_g1_i1 orf=43-273(+)